MSLRLIVPWTLAITAIVGGVSSEGAPGRNRPGPSAKSAHKVSPDNAVVETVLVDLLKMPEPESPVEYPEGSAKRIRFTSHNPKYPPKLDDILKRHDPKEWRKLTPEQLRRTWEAAKGIIRRVQVGEHLKLFLPRDKRIIPRNRGEVEKQEEKRFIYRQFGNQVFRVSPPGYSRDGRIAVVFLTYPWSMHHGGDATYVLARQGTGWKVLLRQFVLYP